MLKSTGNEPAIELFDSPGVAKGIGSNLYIFCCNCQAAVGIPPEMRPHALLLARAVFFGAVLTVVPACGSASSSGASNSKTANTKNPVDVVNARMDAYNQHDIATFMATYAEGVEVFTYPDRSLGSGKEHLRSIFEPMFAEGKVEVTVHHQIEKDGYVINHETVDDGAEKTEYVSIYEVRGDLIQSVRFVRD